jgi:hypothetical protein
VEENTRDRIWLVVRVVLMAGSILVGTAIVLIVVAVGDCAAFGGRCPAEAPPLLDDDTFRFAAIGAAIAVGPPVFLADPGLRRLWVAIGAAAAAAVVVGVIARSMVLG